MRRLSGIAVFIAVFASIFAIVVFSLVLDARPSHADPNSPWCAVRTGDGSYWDCHFSSFEQCQSVVVGNNHAFCNENPGYVGPSGGQTGTKAGRRHRS
jgi:hypothetical protein